MKHEILFAGFGGQGLLFVGKFFAMLGLLNNREVSWLPSYGPEMRGGTASCGVVISSESVGSPIVSEPDILVAMNLPSFLRYEPSVKSGGIVFLDSTLVDKESTRTDITVYRIPATRLSYEIGAQGLANMVMAGAILKRCPELAPDYAEQALSDIVSAKRLDLLEKNKMAMAAGRDYFC